MPKVAKSEIKPDPGETSDGYHTFNELYEHRHALWIALCNTLNIHDGGYTIWRSKRHSNGEVMDGWFLLGIGKVRGEQMTYHLPMRLWDATRFAFTKRKAPNYDGHTSDDVLKRLKEHFFSAEGPEDL